MSDAGKIFGGILQAAGNFGVQTAQQDMAQQRRLAEMLKDQAMRTELAELSHKLGLARDEAEGERRSKEAGAEREWRSGEADKGRQHDFALTDRNTANRLREIGASGAESRRTQAFGKRLSQDPDDAGKLLAKQIEAARFIVANGGTRDDAGKPVAPEQRKALLSGAQQFLTNVAAMQPAKRESVSTDQLLGGILQSAIQSGHMTPEAVANAVIGMRHSADSLAGDQPAPTIQFSQQKAGGKPPSFTPTYNR